MSNCGLDQMQHLHNQCICSVSWMGARQFPRHHCQSLLLKVVLASALDFLS
uniref:Uncharacterized protein n=1 Tax=Arundo donax TaxID=35708 RepID=A0A0A9FFF5_ARUDO